MTVDSEPNRADLTRVHILVTGRVQNVGFRMFVQETGIRLAVKGWVRNVNYNQVETVAEGSRAALEEFARMLGTGPRGARVEKTDLSWEPFIGEFPSFSIRTSSGG